MDLGNKFTIIWAILKSSNVEASGPITTKISCERNFTLNVFLNFLKLLSKTTFFWMLIIILCTSGIGMLSSIHLPSSSAKEPSDFFSGMQSFFNPIFKLA